MATILIVDDQPLNRELLCAYFDGAGHTVVEAESGERALELARQIPLDLVLLDVMMPGLDGFETTQRLKQLAQDEFLPVVLITALTDQASRTKGLRAGADEFLTKPVDRVELCVRVANLLSLRAALAALRNKEKALLRRNVELTELDRFKEEMASLLVHDLKNPLTVIAGNLDYVSDASPNLAAECVEALQDARTASVRLSRLISNLLDLARLETDGLILRRTLVKAGALVGPIAHERQALARSRQVALSIDVDSPSAVHVDADILSRVLENILDNSFRYTPRGGCIRIAVREANGRVAIDIGNSGPAIPAAARQIIFEKYGQTGVGHGRTNLGLGLYFCRLAVETHGGTLKVEERSELPTVFALELPAAAV